METNLNNFDSVTAAGQAPPPAETPSGCGCRTAAPASPPAAPAYVYALGRIKPRFSRTSIEREFAQVAATTSETAGLTDTALLHRVLSQPQNRYLARQLCWVFSIEGVETYILAPRDVADIARMIDSLRIGPHLTDIDLVVGVRGPIAPADLCNGLQIPIVVVDQVYSFDVDGLMRGLPVPKGADKDQFTATAEELLMRIMQMADNAGSTDEHRALNYLAVRYHAIYHHTADAHARNFSLAAVDVRPSRLSGIRDIVDVIFSYSNRATDVFERYFVRVDVTEQFPFMVSKLTQYFER